MQPENYTLDDVSQKTQDIQILSSNFIHVIGIWLLALIEKSLVFSTGKYVTKANKSLLLSVSPLVEPTPFTSYFEHSVEDIEICKNALLPMLFINSQFSHIENAFVSMIGIMLNPSQIYCVISQFSSNFLRFSWCLVSDLQPIHNTINVQSGTKFLVKYAKMLVQMYRELPITLLQRRARQKDFLVVFFLENLWFVYFFPFCRYYHFIHDVKMQVLQWNSCWPNGIYFFCFNAVEGNCS